MAVLMITTRQFGEALAEAAAMTDNELRSAARSGVSRSYFVRSVDRNLPMKAVLRLAYLRSNTKWNRPQSKDAAHELRSDFDIVHIISSEETQRLARQRASVERWMRDGKFRVAVLEIFGARCPITGCEVLEAIDAAHIRGVADEGDDDPKNGLVLRTDLHRLFDAHLMSVNPADGTVCIDSDCDASYGDYHGKVITLPKRGPSLSQFENHYRTFCEETK